MTPFFPLFPLVRGTRTAGRPVLKCGPSDRGPKIRKNLLAFNGDLPIKRSRGYDNLLGKRARGLGPKIRTNDEYG